MSQSNGTNGKPNQEPARIVAAHMEALAARFAGKRVERVIPDDPAFAERYPALWAWLSATQIGEAFDKEPARISLNCEGGSWRVSLTDSALECQLSVLGLTWATGIEALERELSSGKANFQLFKKRGQKKLVEREKKKKK